MATSAAFVLCSTTECIGPPTMPSPKKDWSWVKIGALATAESRSNALRTFMGHACRINIQQEPKDRTMRWKRRRVLLNFSNESSLYHRNCIRPASGAVRLRVSSNQNVSFGDAPITTEIVVVRGRTRRIFSKNSRSVSVELATTVSFSSVFEATPGVLTAVKTIGVFGKQVFAVPLDKFAAGAPMAMIRSGG